MRRTIRNISICFWMVGFISFFLANSARSATFQVGGDLRALGEFFGNKTLNTTGSTQNTAQLTLRALLRPKLFIADKFILVSEWSLLEPAYDEFPITITTPTFPKFLLNTVSIKGYPMGVLGSSSALKIAPFRVTELYFRWDEDVLKLHVGRQARHFGLGLIYDDGQGSVFSNFKSVVDGIILMLPYGELEVQVGAFKNAEAFFNTELEEITHFYAQARHKQEASLLETGVFFEYVFMGERTAEGTCSGSPSARSKGGGYFIVDGYGVVYPVSKLRIMAEAAYIDGEDPFSPCASPTWNTMSAFAIEGDISYMMPLVELGIGSGFHQGDKDGSADGKNSAFIFGHPNRFVSHMIHRVGFGQAYTAGAAASPLSLYPYQTKPGFFLSGTGIFYIKAHGKVVLGSDWEIMAELPIMWAQELGAPFAGRAGKFLGAELTLMVSHPWSELLNTSLFASGVLPGNFFKVGSTEAKFGYLFGFVGQIRI